MKNIIFPIFLWAQKYIIKLLNSISKGANIRVLHPMYLMCDATAHTIIYCGGIKINFSIFIFLSAYHKYKKYEKYFDLDKR